jgi:peptide/nickel transport system ATP-binding protein
MLTASELAFRYSKQGEWLFRGFSLEVAPGEVVGLRGPSGRGKTTLAKVLAGFLRPVEGNVQLDGALPPRKGHSPIQLVFQHPELAVNPRWRMEQVLGEGSEIAPEVIEALGIEPGWRRRWPHELSGGELQRFSVARALGSETRYLIADEMTTMLDGITQAQIWGAVLAEARRRSMGLLVISHEAPLVERICDRVIEL